MGRLSRTHGRRRFVAAALLSLTLGAATAAEPKDGRVEGPVSYAKDGIVLDGKTLPWRAVTRLAESDGDPARLRPALEERSRRSADTAAGHAALGRWCRENGLEAEARSRFERALQLEPNHEAARKALGWVRVADGWRAASAVYPEKGAALETSKRDRVLELATWCREYALEDEAWKLLAGLAIRDAWDRPVIRLLKPLATRRLATTACRPPLAGRWKAVVDSTEHHQLKVFAIFAMDYMRHGPDGRICAGRGTRVEDFYGWNEPIYAVADGTVSQMDDHFPDQPAGVLGKFGEGNYLELRHTDTEYSMYAHLRKGSATVKPGDAVKKGQLLAHIGNSGAAGQPHLHFAFQTPVYDAAGKGQWIGIPYRFEDFRVVEAGGTACSIEVERAKPQEGWVMEFPKPE
ncbi:MAG: peptidoglycan DD-metalloendopeptidase family protein [Planctomycetes bacterium]|nr:peptidoglycan DD-metalloendopeptidase family protein [Planctomycetota bacterium]